MGPTGPASPGTRPEQEPGHQCTHKTRHGDFHVVRRLMRQLTRRDIGSLAAISQRMRKVPTYSPGPRELPTVE